MRSLPETPSLVDLHRQAKDQLIEIIERRDNSPSLVDAKDHVASGYGFATWDALLAEARRRRHDRVGAVPATQAALLTNLSTHDNPHSTGTLFDHLSATRDLLIEWGNDEAVCAAGLFHSIYGTEYYGIRSADLDRRADVAAVIGEEAEALAYLFCMTDRRGFFEQADRAHPVLRDRVHDVEITIAPEVLDGLIEIEIANCVEQIHPSSAKPTTVEGLRGMLEAGGDRMSEGARTALAGLIDELTGGAPN